MSDSDPGPPVFEWRIEEILAAHPDLYLEHCAAMAVAVMSRGTEPPFDIEVDCTGFSPAVPEGTAKFQVRVSWSEETAAHARRVLQSEQRVPIVERAGIAIAALLVAKLIPGAEMRVTRRGMRADYWLPALPAALEVSATERAHDLQRRHAEKREQVLSNPLGWPGYVILCYFGDARGRVRCSYHAVKVESQHEPR